MANAKRRLLLAALLGCGASVGASAQQVPTAGGGGPAHVCALTPQNPIPGRVAGNIGVGYTVTSQGTVSNVMITQSSGDPGMDNQALACVRNWHFTPARPNGQAVSQPSSTMIHWGVGQ